MILNTENILDYAISEYLLIIHPNEDISDRISFIKKEFSDVYQKTDAAFGKPHITIANFLQYQMIEPKIITRLHAVAATCSHTKIELNNFGSFPTHTIYVNVTSKIPFQQIVKNIRQHTQQLFKLNNDNKPHYILEPHIPIARKLLPWQYEKAWTEYQYLHFRGTFIANEMQLLKKELNNTKYKTIASFSFLGQTAAVTQGALF